MTMTTSLARFIQAQDGAYVNKCRRFNGEKENAAFVKVFAEDKEQCELSVRLCPTGERRRL